MRSRAWFDEATRGVVALVDGVGPEQWSAPGLGEWDVRSLVGHTTRAWRTVEQYLGAEPRGPVLTSTPAYYDAVRSGLADPVAVTQRGREAGVGLGDDPGASVHEIARRATATVAAAPDDATVATPVGPMTLADYLPTRAFELTVHGIDLARALRVDLPQELVRCAPSALALAADVASPDQQVALLVAATGRQLLPPGFTVI